MGANHKYKSLPMYQLLFLPFIIGYLIPLGGLSTEIVTANEQYKGTEDLNIKLVQRDVITNEDAQLFRQLFLQNQNSFFTFQQDGDIEDGTCYDDKLPTEIIIYKGERNNESDREMVDRLRACKNNKKLTFAIITESELFGFKSQSVEEEYAIKVKSLQRELVKHSIVHYLDSLNNLVYIINGTQINSVLQNI